MNDFLNVPDYGTMNGMEMRKTEGFPNMHCIKAEGRIYGIF